jgi:hypothetical protein
MAAAIAIQGHSAAVGLFGFIAWNQGWLRMGLT